MPEKLLVALLIDGNNLAHFLYPNLLPGQKMNEETSRRLVSHLDSYTRTYPEWVSIELFLDRSQVGGWKPLPSLRIFPAEYPLSADDILIERFWYHHTVEQPYLVITNDENILEEVADARGNTLRVSDFVRRVGILNPVFREPAELPRLEQRNGKETKEAGKPSLRSSVYFRISRKESLSTSGTGWSARKKRLLSQSTAVLTQSSLVTAASEPRDNQTREAEQPFEIEQVPEPAPETILPQRENLAFEGPFYQVDFDRWPIPEGLRFLKQAFCPAHRKEYRDLFTAINYENPKTSDLRALAELLLYACGDEPDFLCRGSTMDRVRLALIQAGGELLTASEIAQRTGMKVEGLQAKIRKKAGGWVSIL